MTQPQAFAPSYALVETTEEFEALCERLIRDGKPFGFDIETSYDGEPREEAQLHPEENFICGLSFTNAFTWARYAPLRHDDFEGNLDNERCAMAFWRVLQTGLGVAHGAKFELRCMSRWFTEYIGDLMPDAARCVHGWMYFPIRSCTLLESYAEGDNPSHGLKDLTFRTFRHKMCEILELFPKMTQKDQKAIRFSSLNPRDPKVIDYACEDSLWALANHCRRYPKLKDYFIYQLEMAVLPVVCEMEDEGIYYDWNFLREGSQRGQAFRDRLSTEISNNLTALVQGKDPSEPPVRINLGAPAQISKILYDKLGYSTRRRTKSGKMSTDKVAMKGLSQQYPVVKKILNWKSLTKLIGTYLDKYERVFSYAPDGRTHSGWLQHGVPAGRFAAAGPPVQQSPKKYHFILEDGTVFDFNFRDSIAAPAGWYLLGFDYAQQEVRVLAGEAGETALVEAFARGIDVHKFTAAMMLGKHIDEVTGEERDLGKTLGLALGYQMGVDGLADRLGIPKHDAQALFDQYFGVFPRIKSYMDSTVAGAKARGYVMTRFGRKVMIWGLQSLNRREYADAERTAGNAPIQGAGTGDYPKIAMVRSDKALEAAGLRDRVRLMLNMHDALYWYVRDDVPPAQAIRVLQPAVVFPVDGWPPLVAEWQLGRRWGSVREVEILDDGSIRLKEKKEPQAKAVELDGDAEEGDDGLPDTVRWTPVPAAAAAVPAQAALAVPPVSGPCAVVITMDRMPTAAQYQAFSAACGSGTGLNEVLFRVPEGKFVISQSAADPAWEAQISMVLGGASVQYAETSREMGHLVSGLAF